MCRCSFYGDLMLTWLFGCQNNGLISARSAPEEELMAFAVKRSCEKQSRGILAAHCNTGQVWVRLRLGRIDVP